MSNVCRLPYSYWAKDYDKDIKDIEKRIKRLKQDERLYLVSIYTYLENKLGHNGKIYRSALFKDFGWPTEKLEYYMRHSVEGTLWLHAYKLYEDENFYLD